MNQKEIYDNIDRIVKSFPEVTGATLEDFLDTVYTIFDNKQEWWLLRWPSLVQRSMWNEMLQLYSQHRATSHDRSNVRYDFMQAVSDYNNGRVKLA